MSFTSTLNFFISFLMTLQGWVLSSESIFTLLSPDCTTGAFPAIASLKLPPFYEDLLLTLLWNIVACFTCGLSFMIRSTVYWQPPTLRFIRQQYHAYQRDLLAFAPLRKDEKSWSKAAFNHLLLLAICGPSDVLMPSQTEHDKGFLHDLPPCPGSRPTPSDTKPDRDVYDHLHQRIDQLDAREGTLYQGDSFLQPGAKALLAHCNRVTFQIFHKFGSEIAHWDVNDGKLCVVLHPKDTKAVIQTGWGERHPLARTGSWWEWFFSTYERRAPVPEYLTVIYPPISTEEVETVMEIVEAGFLFIADPTEFLFNCRGCENHHRTDVKLWCML